MCPGGGDGSVEGAVPGGCFLHRGHDATGSDTRGWPPARPCLHRRLHPLAGVRITGVDQRLGRVIVDRDGRQLPLVRLDDGHDVDLAADLGGKVIQVFQVVVDQITAEPHPFGQDGVDENDEETVGFESVRDSDDKILCDSNGGDEMDLQGSSGQMSFTELAATVRPDVHQSVSRYRGFSLDVTHTYDEETT